MIKNRIAHYNLKVLDVKSFRIKRIYNSVFSNMILMDEKLPSIFTVRDKVNMLKKMGVSDEKSMTLDDVRRAIRFILKHHTFRLIFVEE